MDTEQIEKRVVPAMSARKDRKSELRSSSSDHPFHCSSVLAQDDANTGPLQRKCLGELIEQRSQNTKAVAMIYVKILGRIACSPVCTICIARGGFPGNLQKFV